jgi:hypothetical protein
MSNRLTSNKARENDKSAGKRHRSTSPGVGKHSYSIQPDLLQRALKDAQVARPETMMQLQRLVGNRVVNQLLDQQRGERPQPVVNSSAHTSTPPVQRLFDFNFWAHAGGISSAYKKHDKDFSEIVKAYEEYKKSKTITEEYEGLKQIITLSSAWMTNHGQKHAGTKKVSDLEQLLALAKTDLRKVAYVHYMNNMETGAFKYITSSGSGGHRRR